MMILYALGLALLITLGLVARWYLSLNKQSTEIIDMVTEIEHKEWLANRRANMTQEQRDSEDFYYSQLRNAPESERFKQRTGNSLSKDLLGFDLLPK